MEDVGEAALYGPVKRFLEALGYEVKGEVRGCDLVARRGDEPPVIVELKLRFYAGAGAAGHRPAGDERAGLCRGAAPAAVARARPGAGSADDPPPVPPPRARADLRRPRHGRGRRGAGALPSAAGAASRGCG